MKTTNQIKIALRDATNAVNKLFQFGYQVIDINMSQERPVLTIKPPKKKALPGTEIQCIRGRGAVPERVMAAPFEGCLVTWSVDQQAMQ